MAGAKQNAVGEWVFGKHARRPPWWQEEVCRRRQASGRFQLTRRPIVLEAASCMPARMH